MKQPHKHAALIKAWADGAEIEVFDYRSEMWTSTISPAWNFGLKYRIKPELKPDVSFRLIVRQTNAYPKIYWPEHCEQPNIQFTFDGETGKLKKAEVIE